MTSVCISVDVDVDLGDIETADLIEELKGRNDSLYSHIDEHTVNDLSGRVEFALARNDKVAIKAAIIEYFDKIHGFNTMALHNDV